MTEQRGAWIAESELAALDAQIKANWSRCQTLDFEGVDGVAIHAVCAPAVDAAANGAAILLLPGRTEPLVKYRDLAFELNRRGHALYLIDHRGQGQSGRLLADPERGHVVDFEHYVDDVERFLDARVLADEPDKLVLFGHSMGGCIAARLLQRRSDTFSAAVLFSPMLEIATGLVPGWVASAVTTALSKMPFGLGDPEAYVPGGHGFEPTPFKLDGELNPLTNSETRLERCMRDYVDIPETRLGSPTRHWFDQAMDACAAAIRDAAMITCPTLLFSAGDDPIVEYGGQRALCAGSDAVEGPRVVAQARHELLMERDDIRATVLDEAFAFVERVAN
ncbi:MAG: alpha/beta fold hydrolase [Pseudomonadota bacterium]